LCFDPLNGADQGGSAGANGDNVICVDPNDVRGPGVERRRALAGKVMPLIDGCDPEQSSWRVRKDLVDHDRIESQPRQGGNARSPQVMQAPRGKRRGLAPNLFSPFDPRLDDRRIEVALASPSMWAMARENELRENKGI
jgi:hypothetical protein